MAEQGMAEQIEIIVSEPQRSGSGRRAFVACAVLAFAALGGTALGLAAKAYIDRTVAEAVAAAMSGPALSSRVEAIARDKTAEAIRSQPAAIAEALNSYIAQQQQEAQRKEDDGVRAVASEMRDSAGLPTRGPADAKATVVYFFDSNCPYCKQMEPILNALADGGAARVVYREIPILGQGSVTASKFGAALRQVAPEKWAAFHAGVMANRGHVDDAAVMRIAMATAGQEATARAMEALADPKSAEPVQRNLDLARRAGIHGTPFMMVGDTFFKGAVGADEMRAAVAKAAAGG